ncbi:hypothetical protein DIPPA_12664 [Diplonema papillatum]|nr:hypothetical protein DIPPA_12664 [Diplonema papillatum]
MASNQELDDSTYAEHAGCLGQLEGKWRGTLEGGVSCAFEFASDEVLVVTHGGTSTVCTYRRSGDTLAVRETGGVEKRFKVALHDAVLTLTPSDNAESLVLRLVDDEDDDGTGGADLDLAVVGNALPASSAHLK